MAVRAVRSPLVRDRLAAGRVGLPPMPKVRPPQVGQDPAVAVTFGWASGGLILAAWLHREGHRPMCSVIRSPGGLACLAVFLGHLADLLGPLDPINAVSRRIPQRRFP